MSTRVIDEAQAICAAERAKRDDYRTRRAAEILGVCACGKPAVINGRCRGCDEDHFYGRDIPGARYTGD